jgi:nitroreductase
MFLHPLKARIVSWLRGSIAPSGFTSIAIARLVAGCGSCFSRESHSVLYGIKRYYQMGREPIHSSALLRRNTHRLEKGLVMRPRRPVFAADYIADTVGCYGLCLGSAQAGRAFNRVELQWAHNVLQEYFNSVQSHPVIDQARAKFAALPHPAVPAHPPLVPYRRALELPLKISYDDLLELAQRRRSVRWFQQRTVPRELIDKAILVGGLAPSACNRQPFEFRVYDDPALVKKIVELPGGVSGYSHNVPVVVVVIGQLRNFKGETDRHLIYIDGSLAIMGFLFGLETQGLSSCCINWPDIEEKEVRMAQLLGLSPDERTVMLVALGFPEPEGKVPYSAKKPLEILRSYNATSPVFRMEK